MTPGLRRRMACWLYEGVLVFAVVFLSDYLFSSLSQTRNALNNRNPQQAFLFVVLGIYFVWFWSKGQTLAMKTWNIRVVDRQGQPISQTRALARYALCWLWFLPPLAVLSVLPHSGWEMALACLGWIAIWALLSRFQREQQFWHDAWAGTRLISTATPLPKP